MRASARGIPTAHPTINPVLEEPELPEEELLFVLAVLTVGSGVGVTRTDLIMVWTPADPDETLVIADEKGVGVAEGEDEAGGGADDAGALVAGEVPLLEPLARPVMDARFGWFDAWFLPIVAYALPSWSWKNGRGAGDSWQHFTFTLSALQHQSLLWSEHCVKDSAPYAVLSACC
jgi:hypothetical protein